MQSLRFPAMNTSVLLALESEGASDQGLRRTREFVEACERRFSRFLPDSELSRLNSLPGQWVEVSDDLFDLLMISKAYFQETGGLFDPAILPDLRRAGYDLSIDQVRNRVESQAAAANRQDRPTLEGLELNLLTHQVRMPQGMEIDLGGIAKGWIVQQAAALLKTYGSAAGVSAGGDMVFAGLPADGNEWHVQIEDPREERRTAAVLKVGEGAVVTSSITKRAWKYAGETRHHIIDPRTGQPAQTEWLSVTIVAPEATLAEAYAKALLIGGRQEATRLMLQRPRLAVFCIGPNGQIFASPNSKDYLSDYTNEPLQ